MNLVPLVLFAFDCRMGCAVSSPGDVADLRNMNSLLASLPPRVLRKVLSDCDLVELSVGEVLSAPGQRIRQIYFPVEGFFSHLVAVDDRENFEVALIGSEGMLGIPLVLGVNISFLTSVVQDPGFAQRMASRTFLRALARHPALRSLLHRYMYVSWSQLARTASCNSFHALDARLARWLLLADDRSEGNGFHITQELLAQLLGVRRVGVTNAAGKLQRHRMIHYHRGEITVLDRAGLEAASCACYQNAIDSYRRILG